MKSKWLLNVALFAALTCTGGLIRIPFFPVPLTLQTFFVYLSGVCLGAKRGALSQIIYIVIGLMGVPVFSSGGGPAYVLHPTFGYLVGFPVGAFVIGTLACQKSKSADRMRLLSAISLGMLFVYFLGILYLWINMNWIVRTPVSIVRALWIGGVIFLPGEVIKIALSAELAKKLMPIMGFNKT